MRVLLLTYEIEGLGGSWVRAFSLARGLVTQGHEVTLWCARNRDAAKASPVDDLAGAGTERWVRGVEIVAFDGVIPQRFRHGGLDPSEIARRLLALRRLCRGARRSQPSGGPAFDLVHGFGHRPTVAWIGRALSKRLGIPYLADWADLWGMEGIGGRRRGLSRAIFGRADHRWERSVYSRVEGLSVIASDLARRASDWGVADERIHLCPVGADVEGIAPQDRGPARLGFGLPLDAPIACYVGFNNNDAEYLANSFVALARRIPNVHLVMVGIALPEFDAIVRRAGLTDRMIHHGVVPHAQLSSHLACADVMLLPYLDRPINRGRYPNKIGDYMAAGRPTVANATGDLGRLIEESGAGVLAGERPEDFAEAAASLLRDPERAAEMGKRARTAAEETSWSALAAGLAGFYRRVCEARGGGAHVGA